MNPVAIAEFTTAGFVAISLLATYKKEHESKGAKWIRFCLFSLFLYLIVDALAWIIYGPNYPYALVFIIDLLAYTCGTVVILLFIRYVYTFMNSKTKVSAWWFLTPVLFTVAVLVLSNVEFFSGNILVVNDGVVTDVNDFPAYLRILQMCTLAYLLVLSFVKSKDIGIKAVLLLGLYNVAPIAGSVIAIYTDFDPTCILTAAAIIMVASILERDEQNSAFKNMNHELETANDSLKRELQRTIVLQNIVHSGRWSFFYDKDDNIIGSNVAKEVGDITHNPVTSDGKSWLDIVHPNDRKAAWEAFQATLKDHKNKTPYNVNYRMIGDDKKYRWFNSAGQIIEHADGVREFFGIHVDITEQMLQQQSRLLGAVPLSNDVLSKANIGLWAFELDEGQPPRMYADQTMLGLLGLDHQIPPEEIYHAWYDNINKDSYELVNDAVSKMANGEHAEVQYPWHNPNNGKTLIVRCGGIKNFSYKKGIRIEGTHQNVSEVLHFDEEQQKIERARIEAELSNKAKTEFLFNMSHDIRTPMNAILGYTDIALHHSHDEKRVEDSLEKIKFAGEHLLHLINDILEMSRIEAGKMELTSAPLNIKEVATNIVNLSATLAETKNLNFSSNIADLENEYVFADELHVNEIVLNLISNAVKYTKSGGSVEYNLEQVGKVKKGFATYRLTIKDTGIGMSKEFQKHLFESFAREQNLIVAKQEGAGLGLSIVKRIVELIGGTISFESELGEGTTFVVDLPFKVMNQKEIDKYLAEKNKKESSQDSSFKGAKVLVAEDNALNREITTDMLENFGFDVTCVEDGSLAVEEIKKKGPNYYKFILMDIQMPIMDGYEATKKIRKLSKDKHIPIIAISANAFIEDRRASLKAGMDEHLAKPINSQTLFDALERLK